jgi:hypothetical protein
VRKGGALVVVAAVSESMLVPTTLQRVVLLVTVRRVHKEQQVLAVMEVLEVLEVVRTVAGVYTAL